MSLESMAWQLIVCMWILIIGISINSKYSNGLGYFLISLGGSIGATILLLGFALHANIHTEKTIIVKMKADTIIKTKYNVHVEIDKKNLIFSSKKEYDNITDTTTFYKKININYYGTKIDSTYETKIK